jgi:class 3 adenylate cyclase
LLHPVLSDVIGRANPDYLQRVDRVNIVGYGRPWRETESADHAVRVERLCVLKADVFGFGTLMRSGADGPVRKALADALKRWSQGASIVETRGGDSFVIVHDDALALARMARHLMDEVYQAPGQPRLRMALHHGDVQIRQGDGDLGPLIGGGDAILCAARVEPHVAPGQIWATEEFREELARKPSLWRTTPVPGPAGDSFNVKKEGGTEPDLWVRLYRLEL